MIITRTPYRVSLAGGGTDLRAFCDHEPGAVLSCAVRSYMHVTLHDRIDGRVRVGGPHPEEADHIDGLRHAIVREGLRQYGLVRGVEVTTIGDVPGGTGLGSSSSLAVGLLHAAGARAGGATTPGRLAAAAAHLEIVACGRPIGRQDQYAVAHGGVNYITFRGAAAAVEPVACAPRALGALEDHALMFYTGGRRDAHGVLAEQSRVTPSRLPALRRMRDLAGLMRAPLARGDVGELAALLDEGWGLKRSLGCGTTSDLVDDWHARARAAGAWGGKLLGAGGSGFLFLLAPPAAHAAIRAAVGRPVELPFRVDPRGSRVIFSDRDPVD